MVFITVAIVFDSCSLQRLADMKVPKLPHILGKKKVVDTVLTETPDTSAKKFAIYPQPDSAELAIEKKAEEPKTAALDTKLFETVSHKKEFKTASMKAKAHYEGPSDQQDFTAFIRIKKDSAIWINIYGLGGVINAARVLITKDSFTMLNYIQKEVTKLPLSEVAKVLPTNVDFQNLQNIIMGEIIREGSLKGLEELTSSVLLKIADDAYLQEITVGKNDSLIGTERMTTHTENGPVALLRYDEYTEVERLKIAMKRDIAIKNGADVFNLQLNLMNVSINNPVEMPFSIPANYTKK